MFPSFFTAGFFTAVFYRIGGLFFTNFLWPFFTFFTASFLPRAGGHFFTAVFYRTAVFYSEFFTPTQFFIARLVGWTGLQKKITKTFS